MSTVYLVLNKIRWLLDANILDEENFRFWLLVWNSILIEFLGQIAPLGLTFSYRPVLPQATLVTASNEPHTTILYLSILHRKPE